MNLTELQKRILKLLDKEGVLTPQLIVKNLQTPQVTASRNLSRLVQSGYLTAIGKGRGVHYIPRIGATLEEIKNLKEELDSNRPFPPEIVKNIDRALVGRFIYATNGIEGSKLTLRETDLILAGATIRGSRNEIKDVKNQQNALKFVYKFISSKKEITEEYIKKLQAEVTSGTVDVFLNGKYRDNDVGIAGTSKLFPSPSKIKSLMAELLVKINWMEKKGQHPALIATYAHYQLVAIHPFFDGNGRTARLLMNTILLRHNYPTTIVELSRRQEYYDVLQHADEGVYDIFQAFIFGAIKKSLDFYLNILKS